MYQKHICKNKLATVVNIERMKQFKHFMLEGHGHMILNT